MWQSAQSNTSIATLRSRISRIGPRKLKTRWWERRPIFSNALFIDLQKGSYFASIFTLLESVLQISLAIFDIYCLLEAVPGSKHSRNLGISFMFVYSGNQHVRKSLITVASLLLISGIYLLVSSIILITALRKENELKFRHWLRAMVILIIIRFISIIYQSIVNDLYFSYHQLMLALWILLTIINVFTWLVVYSNYQELSEASSLNESRTFSHYSLDSHNPYVANQPFTLYNSYQNISASRSSTFLTDISDHQKALPAIPRSHHSSRNSLHASYLQMYCEILSKRSRQSSEASLSKESAV